MDEISKALDGWMPKLVDTWRSMRRARGPEGRLLPEELRLVANGVRRLSQGLTRGRRLVGARYMDDPELLGAYLLYFWPISYAQGRQVLGEIGQKPRTLLDLGSGPGPLAMAALDGGAREVMAADRSEPALKLAERLASLAGNRLSTRSWDPMADAEVPGAKIGWNVITMGHALNELWVEAPDRIERRAALCLKLLGFLRKGGSLVIVEPALRETTRDLLRVRDRMVEAGHAVRAPCLYRGGCPALEREVDWCHAEREWSPPPVLASIIEQAGMLKETLKMSYLVLAPKGEAWPVPPSGRLYRVVSEQLRGHGRSRVIGCGVDGRIPLSVPDEVRSPSAERLVRSRRGDLLRLSEVTETEGGGLRLGSNSGVDLVRRSGEPL